MELAFQNAYGYHSKIIGTKFERFSIRIQRAFATRNHVVACTPRFVNKRRTRGGFTPASKWLTLVLSSRVATFHVLTFQRYGYRNVTNVLTMKNLKVTPSREETIGVNRRANIPSIYHWILFDLE